MLPYSSLNFFLLSALLVALVYGAKPLLARVLPFRRLIAALCVGYLLIFLPEHCLGIALFVVYEYAVCVWAKRRAKPLPRSVVILLLVAPLLLSKLWIDSLIHVLGLSYMTFRAVRYSTERVEADFWDFTAFVTFFPAILAGPLDKYGRFQADLRRGYDGLGPQAVTQGFRLIALGVLMKFVVGELIERHGLGSPWVQRRFVVDMYAYSAFLYFDFAGYSAMAMGLGRCLGIDVPENFHHPYLSQNYPDFWKRWHITLGEWLRDIFFQPIYLWLHRFPRLKPRKLLMQNIASYLTFQLMGAWNGLNLRYLVCGALFGIYFAVYNTYAFYRKRAPAGETVRRPGWLFLARFVTVTSACFALYVFAGRWTAFERVDRRVADAVALFLGTQGDIAVSGRGLAFSFEEATGRRLTPKRVALLDNPGRQLLLRGPDARWRNARDHDLDACGRPCNLFVREGRRLDRVWTLGEGDEFLARRRPFFGTERERLGAVLGDRTRPLDFVAARGEHVAALASEAWGGYYLLAPRSPSPVTVEPRYDEGERQWFIEVRLGGLDVQAVEIEVKFPGDASFLGYPLTTPRALRELVDGRVLIRDFRPRKSIPLVPGEYSVRVLVYHPGAGQRPANVVGMASEHLAAVEIKEQPP